MIRLVKNWIGTLTGPWIGFLMGVLISVSASCATGQSTGLKWKLEKDDQFGIVLVQSSKSETKIDARETTNNSDIVLGMDWVVTEVDSNGDATIEQALTSVNFLVSGFTRKKQGDTAVPLKTIRFDTAAPTGITKESKQLMSQIQPLLGLKFSVVMSPLGEIKKVTVSDDVTAQLNKMPDTLKLRALFSKAGLQDILGAATFVLPEDLSAGQSWTETSTFTTALGSFERKRTYTFVGEKAVDGTEVAEFSVNIALDPSAGSETKSVSGSLDSKLLEFTGNGTLLMDIEGGFFKTSKIENRAHSEKPYREKKIDTVVTNQIEMTVTKK